MLYNKYRPKKIADLVGQDAAKTFLSKIDADSVPHTIIFYGPSGTGKTTAARLLAKKIHCENPTSDGDVCGVCYGCQSVENGTTLDYMEIDATSSGGVNDIRELKDRLLLTTLSGKPRIVYIDEAHNLSKQAFDALLKILEEESSNIFVLATTEQQKVPKTIRTRSFEVSFLPATKEDIVALVKRVAVEEGYSIDDKVLGMIAFIAEGSYRRALVLLEDVLMHAKTKTITEDDLEDLGHILSVEEIDIINAFKPAFFKGDWGELMNVAKKLPTDDKKLRPIAYHMYNLAISIVTNASKKVQTPRKIDKARFRFISTLSEALMPNQAITKPALVKAIVDFLLEMYR